MEDSGKYANGLVFWRLRLAFGLGVGRRPLGVVGRSAKVESRASQAMLI
jgi:hypothetical protein